ncbi:MAG: radical SAM protein [Thioalkalispiraceae bacterium]|jgi:wyosine [tRNA(Phe)-imidazoG37] synthetase (radical SAM superfamily)
MNVPDLALLTFGPVPSRRLGRSLGINNIPPKNCSYSCLYCQVGRTLHREIQPREFYKPADIFQAVQARVAAVQAAGEKIDYLTFVPDGEPTLDSQLDGTIGLLRRLDIKIAVISNASLIWREDVQTKLHNADTVSLKLDTVDENQWKQINQPHEDLNLLKILQGIESFAKKFKGSLITETMLLADINDSRESVTAVAEFLTGVQPATAYIAVPTRPTSEANIFPPAEEVIVQAYDIFSEKLADVEYLIGYEGNAFAFSGDIEQDLLSITAVHPMREEAVNEMLSKAELGWESVQKLIENKQLKKVEFAGKVFYVRQLATNR